MIIIRDKLCTYSAYRYCVFIIKIIDKNNIKLYRVICLYFLRSNNHFFSQILCLKILKNRKLR